MSFFKRATTHYGKTPEPETPYQRAAQVWDERIGSARVQARNWRLMAFGCLILSTGFASALVWQSARGTVVPWAVEVDRAGDVKNLHFPGISPEAAKVLVDRRVDGVGIDTASLDHGPSTDFRTHRILNGAGIYGLENLAALDLVPSAGATLLALPMKIRNGTGGPVRVIALLP